MESIEGDENDVITNETEISPDVVNRLNLIINIFGDINHNHNGFRSLNLNMRLTTDSEEIRAAVNPYEKIRDKEKSQNQEIFKNENVNLFNYC